MKCPTGSRPMKNNDVITGSHQAHTHWLRYVTALLPYGHVSDGRSRHATLASAQPNHFAANGFRIFRCRRISPSASAPTWRSSRLRNRQRQVPGEQAAPRERSVVENDGDRPRREQHGHPVVEIARPAGKYGVRTSIAGVEEDRGVLGANRLNTSLEIPSGATVSVKKTIVRARRRAVVTTGARCRRRADGQSAATRTSDPAR